MTSYQKLKAKNAELQKDIYYMVMEPEGKGLMTKAGWYHKFSIAKMVTFGSMELRSPISGGGLLAQMERNDNGFIKRTQEINEMFKDVILQNPLDNANIKFIDYVPPDFNED